MSSDKLRGTLEQLPSNAKFYYAQTTAMLSSHPLYSYAACGKDELGRRVYQRCDDNGPIGKPLAELTYREYSTAVKDWAARSSSMGVQRFTFPWFSDETPDEVTLRIHREVQRTR